jgi:hypothetical protein
MSQNVPKVGRTPTVDIYPFDNKKFDRMALQKQQIQLAYRNKQRNTVGLSKLPASRNSRSMYAEHDVGKSRSPILSSLRPKNCRSRQTSDAQPACSSLFVLFILFSCYTGNPPFPLPYPLAYSSRPPSTTLCSQNPKNTLVERLQKSNTFILMGRG